VHCSVTTEEKFREIDFGDFEGKLYDDIAQEYPAIYRQWMESPTETQFPNGENFVQMQARVVDAAYKLYARHHGETIAIISHSGVNRILLAAALGVSNANIFRIAQRYAARNLITLFGDYPSVELMNA
jgi:broad specificity phosphatase PhoE